MLSADLLGWVLCYIALSFDSFSVVVSFFLQESHCPGSWKGKERGPAVCFCNLWMVSYEFHSLGVQHPEGSLHSYSPLWEPQSWDFSFTRETFFPLEPQADDTALSFLGAIRRDFPPVFSHRGGSSSKRPLRRRSQGCFLCDANCVPQRACHRDLCPGHISAGLSSPRRFHFIVHFCLLHQGSFLSFFATWLKI